MHNCYWFQSKHSSQQYEHTTAITTLAGLKQTKQLRKKKASKYQKQNEKSFAAKFWNRNGHARYIGVEKVTQPSANEQPDKKKLNWQLVTTECTIGTQNIFNQNIVANSTSNATATSTTLAGLIPRKSTVKKIVSEYHKQTERIFASKF